jgi:hypothetical protein
LQASITQMIEVFFQKDTSLIGLLTKQLYPYAWFAYA